MQLENIKEEGHLHQILYAGSAPDTIATMKKVLRAIG